MVSSSLLSRVIVTLLAAALLVGGVMLAGARFRNSLRENHSIAVNEILCQPPPGLTREAFLDEVHYYGQLPQKLDTFDGDLPARLRAAFAKHPRVERVEDIKVTPPRTVRVELVFRQR